MGNAPTSMSTHDFSSLGVPARLVDILAQQGIASAFPIQVATLPDSLTGRDVLGRGRTGSGKTLAFALPTDRVRPPSEAQLFLFGKTGASGGKGAAGEVAKQDYTSPYGYVME